MRARIAVLAGGLVVALGGAARGEETCPAVPDHGAAKVELLRDLRLARNPMEAQEITGALWRLWAEAPDARAQEMLEEGMRLIHAFDTDGAVAVLDGLVAYCPDYAEGWNQRAFARYLGGAHEEALADLDRALEIEPGHVPALAGKALTLFELGREDEGQVVLREAVRMNPWLAERAMLRIPMDVEL